jgi:iron complex outermembrane receptor protein
VTAGAGERGVFQGSLRTSHLVTENLGIKLSGQYLTGDEWEYEDPAEQIELTKFQGPMAAFFRQDLIRAAGITPEQADERIGRIGARDFDIERWSGEARADWRATDDLTTVFSVGSTNSASGIELTGLGAGQVQDWRYTYYQARANWNRFFGQVYLNTSDAGETFLLRNGASIVDRSKLFVAQAQHGMSLGTMQNFTYGVDYLHTMPETEGTINGIYEDNDETREFGAYLQSETELNDQFEIVLAGRMDTHSALPDPIFSPRAALVFTPQENHAFRVTYNRAFSTPSSLTQFLDLGTTVPNSALAQLGYSIRVQGTGDQGFNFRQADGGYLMRSPFTPLLGLGEPGQLLPANAAAFWRAAVSIANMQSPLPPDLLGYLLGLQPTAEQIGTSYLDITASSPTPAPLSGLMLDDVDPIRESTSDTYELGYQGILGGRLLLAGDLWYSERHNLVTPLTIQTPLLLMTGADIATFLVPRFMTDLGYSQAQAVALATQLATGLGQIPLGVISSADVNANGAQILTTYMNVDESIDLWGMDLTASALLTDSWTLGVGASFVNEDVFETSSGMRVMLNAPRKKGNASLTYRNDISPLSGEARVRYTDSYPVNSGVYVGTACLGDTGPLVEDCADSSTLLDLSAGYRLPIRQNAELQLAVTNALDQEYRSFPGSPEIGRMALLRLRYQF